MEQMSPLLRRKLVYDLLNGYAGSDSSIPQMLKTHGIEFPEERYMIGVASYEPGDLKPNEEPESLNLLLFSIIETAFAGLYYTIGTWVEDGRYAFILNVGTETDEKDLNGRIRAECQRINIMLEEQMGITVRFAFSRLLDKVSGISQSYTATRRLLNYRALYYKAEVLFDSEVEASRKHPVFPVSLQHLLVRHVLKGDRSGAEEALELFFTQYIDNGKFSPAKMQETMMVLMGALMNELLKEGYDLEDMEDLQFLLWQDCSDRQELKNFLHARIGRLIDRMNPQEPTKSGNEYVARTIAIIEQRYMDNLTIADLAGELGLTPNYISRLFKQETGVPPLDYLTRYRINKAKELMLFSKHLTLKEISQQVGYPDVHSFIRFFKNTSPLHRVPSASWR
ncbi:AraC family transcriptional regulator [Paenibacillus sp. CC-CFT747]|nr:AraC family transcriptional regulator [Paenibacillus sp. CC-CFT747]